MSGQEAFDLFGHQAAREQWAAQFERRDYPAKIMHGPDAGKWTTLTGWVCPDPDCAEIAANEYQLGLNHGWYPDQPGRAPFDGHCHRLTLLESQARSAQQRAARAQNGDP